MLCQCLLNCVFILHWRTAPSKCAVFVKLVAWNEWVRLQIREAVVLKCYHHAAERWSPVFVLVVWRQGFGRGRSWPFLRHYYGTGVNELRNTAINPRHYNRYPGRDSNRVSSEYKSVALLLHKPADHETCCLLRIAWYSRLSALHAWRSKSFKRLENYYPFRQLSF